MKSSDIVKRNVIHQALKEKVEQYGNREFFRFKDQVFGYRDLDQLSDQVAAGLQGLGIGKGDKVGILMPNRPEFIFVWFGLCKLGAIEVPVNTAHRSDLLVYMLDQSDCRAVVADSSLLDRLAPVLPELPGLEMVVLVDEPLDSYLPLPKPTKQYQELVDNDGSYEPAEVCWSDPFIVMYTSGTTGPSKGSLMPHNYALFMGQVCKNAVGYDENDCLYNALPLFHGNSQLLSAMPALVSGARMVLAERFSASRFWEEVKRYGCTEFNYIGGILPILLGAEPRPDDADNPVRVMFGGGAPPDRFEEFERRFGLKLIEGYGMSEIGLPLMSSLAESKPGSCGKPLPGYEVGVVDDDGLEVPPGTAGELLIRPRNPYTILLEYYRMPEKTLEAWHDLWFHTGDYLYCDDEGWYHFVDRKKDALRRRGENISSYEVEKGINSHQAVLESAVVAVKSDLGEDEVMACVVLKPGQDLSPREMMDHCQEQMAYFMVPRYLRYLTELPKTPTQKVQKAIIRDWGVSDDTWDREAAGYQLRR